LNSYSASPDNFAGSRVRRNSPHRWMRELIPALQGSSHPDFAA
jgi:hypothetical protein